MKKGNDFAGQFISRDVELVVQRLHALLGALTKAIEAKTTKWDKLIEDKTPEMAVWINELRKIVANGVKTYAFFNNHYAGFAPGSVKQFEDLWEKAS